MPVCVCVCLCLCGVSVCVHGVSVHTCVWCICDCVHVVCVVCLCDCVYVVCLCVHRGMGLNHQKGMKSHSLQEPGETFREYYAT